MSAGRTSRELLAELVVLRLFDELRSVAGHDYGAGQRAAELRRRERALDLLDHDAASGAPVTIDERLAAFERIGRPRRRRVEAESYRSDTPASRRTFDTWRRVERLVRSAVRRRDERLASSDPLQRAAAELGIELPPDRDAEDRALRAAAEELGIELGS